MAPPTLFNDRSLSTKLFLLTVMFVLLAEIVVMIPSVAKQRIDWFEARIEAAHLVSLAVEGADGNLVDENVARQLFATANILGVTVDKNGRRILILTPEIDPHGPPRMHRIDLSDKMPVGMIVNAWRAMFSSGDDLIQVTGAPRYAADQTVDIIVSQRALRRDLLLYARNILGLSLVISSFTAALIFWTLNRMIVRPVKQLTDDMAAFEAEPERAAHIHRPSARGDEIGAAGRSLAAMQKRIYELLSERRRLAALGAGISKISHDLRNILASAQLMSDRLSNSDDPQVRKLSPRLLSALDRAIVLSRDTLAFGRMEEDALDRTPVALAALVDEIFEDTAAMGVEMKNDIDRSLMVSADKTQLYRALFNLARNAVDAMDVNGNQTRSDDEPIGRLSVSAEKTDARVRMLIADTGPGLPDYARESLFEPFKGSQKPGGSGLGLAIASEIIRAHGGELRLSRSDERGAVFEIILPDQGAGSIGASTRPVSHTPSRRGSAPPS